MDFDLLKDYLAVIEHGSILAAAEAAGTSQPTLSRRIRELEDSLGVLLLNRTSRGVSPTVYGVAFQQRAEQLLREQQLALDELRSLKNGTLGHARVGVAPALSGYLPLAVAALRKDRPGVTFEVLEGTYDALVQKALKGEIDGAFTMLPPAESLELLAVRKLADEPVVIVADADHPLASSAHVAMDQLAGESWILMNRPRSILDGFFQFASAAGLAAPDVAMETSSLDFMKAMLRRSGLLAAVPRGAVAAELREGTFSALKVTGLPRVETAFVHRHGVLPTLVTELVHTVETVQRQC